MAITSKWACEGLPLVRVLEILGETQTTAPTPAPLPSPYQPKPEHVRVAARGDVRPGRRGPCGLSSATVHVRTQKAIEVLAVCLYHKGKLILESHTLFALGPGRPRPAAPRPHRCGRAGKRRGRVGVTPRAWRLARAHVWACGPAPYEPVVERAQGTVDEVLQRLPAIVSRGRSGREPAGYGPKRAVWARGLP